MFTKSSAGGGSWHRNDDQQWMGLQQNVETGDGGHEFIAVRVCHMMLVRRNQWRARGNGRERVGAPPPNRRWQTESGWPERGLAGVGLNFDSWRLEQAGGGDQVTMKSEKCMVSKGRFC